MARLRPIDFVDAVHLDTMRNHDSSQKRLAAVGQGCGEISGPSVQIVLRIETFSQETRSLEELQNMLDQSPSLISSSRVISRFFNNGISISPPIAGPRPVNNVATQQPQDLGKLCSHHVQCRRLLAENSCFGDLLRIDEE